MAKLLRALGHLIAPRVCRICGRTLAEDEEVMCLHCWLDFPRSDVHRSDFNTIHQRLGHTCVVDRAAGWFLYKKDTPYARLLIDAKYGSLPALAQKLGEICGTELASDHFFDGIHCLVPAPMHWFKRWRRGYNQAHEICQGLSQSTGLPVTEALSAQKGHGVLSRSENRDARFSAMHGTIGVKNAADIKGKHVLIVDDILTTGATMGECVRAIAQASPSAVSVLTLGLVPAI